jgi:hypothetical protein
VIQNEEPCVTPYEEDDEETKDKQN